MKNENKIVDTLAYIPEKKTIVSAINPISMDDTLCWVRR